MGKIIGGDIGVNKAKRWMPLEAEGTREAVGLDFYRDLPDDVAAGDAVAGRRPADPDRASQSRRPGLS